MGCGCSKTRKATAALLGGSTPARSQRRPTPRPEPGAPRVKTRARFRAVPPPGSGQQPVTYSTLYEARSYVDANSGWSMEIVREPIQG